MGNRSDPLKPARKSKITVRFTEHERAVIHVIAGEEGVAPSEAIRRLIFWKRAPDFSNRLDALLQHWQV